jgi:Lrp/AsnC family transcriptional regulator, leucine-responsive regulatory protein
LDEIDKKIVQILQAKPRTPVSRISLEVGKSPTTVRYRIRRLEELKLTVGCGGQASIAIALAKVGKYFMIKTSNNKKETREELERELRKHTIVLTAHMVTGSYTYVAILSDSEKEDYAALVRSVSDIRGVSKTFTMSCVAVVSPETVPT